MSTYRTVTNYGREAIMLTDSNGDTHRLAQGKAYTGTVRCITCGKGAIHYTVEPRAKTVLGRDRRVRLNAAGIAANVFRARQNWRGVIVGETRDRQFWRVIPDGHATANLVHKSFVRPA